MKKIKSILVFLKEWIYIKPIWFINKIFDTNLESFKEEYKQHLGEIFPKEEDKSGIRKDHENFLKRYYEHKKDRRSIFVFFIITIPTFFTAIFVLKKTPNLHKELVAMILFSIFMTWATIHMLTIYRRKIYKKAKQIIAYQERYPYLRKDFLVSKKVNYKNEFKNKFISTTNLYRTTIMLVLIALIILLVESIFL